MYESGSPRSLPGMSKAVVPSPLVYDVVEDGAIYDIGSFSYIEDCTRHRLPVCLRHKTQTAGMSQTQDTDCRYVSDTRHRLPVCLRHKTQTAGMSQTATRF